MGKTKAEEKIAYIDLDKANAVHGCDLIKSEFDDRRVPDRDFVANTMGFFGRMISFSKSFYTKAFPDNLVFFNANVVTIEAGKFEKIWYGDLDVSRREDLDNLRTLARGLQKDVIVLNEMDGRFEYMRGRPLPVERFIIKVSTKGEVTLNANYQGCTSIGTGKSYELVKVPALRRRPQWLKRKRPQRKSLRRSQRKSLKR